MKPVIFPFFKGKCRRRWVNNDKHMTSIDKILINNLINPNPTLQYIIDYKS